MTTQENVQLFKLAELIKNVQLEQVCQSGVEARCGVKTTIFERNYWGFQDIFNIMEDIFDNERNTNGNKRGN